MDKIIQAGLHAIDPERAVQHSIQLEKQTLQVRGKIYNLGEYSRIRLVAFGKASLPMARATRNILENRLTEGLVITRHGFDRGESLENREGEPPLFVYTAGHPIPDHASLAAAKMIEKFLRNCLPGDLLICLISGGGSALVTLPVDGVSLGDLQSLTDLLLKSGAPIDEINVIRKHLDQVKGGGMAGMASQGDKIVLLLSDVIGDPPELISSGPFSPDASTFADAWNIIKKYSLEDQIPAGISSYLRCGLRGAKPETKKPGDPLFKNIQTEIIGSNLQAAQAAQNQAESEGFHSLILTSHLQGEAHQAGKFLASLLQEIALSGNPLPRPACLIAGGETTVTVRGTGLGGRNQELALGAVQVLAGLENISFITLATDGVDGPTEAAGAVVTGNTYLRGLQTGLDPVDFLNKNDSFHYFKTLDDLLITGPTLTNANDLAFLFAF